MSEEKQTGLPKVWIKWRDTKSFWGVVPVAIAPYDGSLPPPQVADVNVDEGEFYGVYEVASADLRGEECDEQCLPCSRCGRGD